jgi:hypothetical protein
MTETDQVTSIRQAAAVCNVTPPAVRRWLFLGLITEPPWTLQHLHQVRDETDPQGRRCGPQVAHGTLARWLEGCDCDECREAQNDASRPADEPGRRRDYRSRCGNSSSTRSMPANRSGQFSMILADFQPGVGGSPRPTRSGPRSWIRP